MPEQTDSQDESRESTSPPVPPFIKAYIDGEIQKAKEHEDTSRKKKFRNSWRSASPITKWTFWLTSAIAIATIAYAVEAYRQLGVMRQQLDQMGRDSQTSSAQFQAQLAHFDDGLGRTGLLATHAGEQAVSAVNAADAATSAAKTAEQALHISERAYLSFGPTDVDTTKKTVTMPVINSGRIPSGAVHINGYNLIVFMPVPGTSSGEILECEPGAKVNLTSVAPGTGPKFGVVLHNLSKESFLSGKQKIIIVGDLSYNDGFSDTPIRHWPMCFESIYHTDLQQNLMLPCDAEHYLPTLEKEPQCHEAKK